MNIFFLGGGGSLRNQTIFFFFFFWGGGSFLYIIGRFKVKIQNGNIFWAANFQIFWVYLIFLIFFFFFFWGGGVGVGGKQ